MRKERIVPTWVSVILIFMCLVAFVVNTKVFTEQSPGALVAITEILEMLATIMAICYCLQGYDKNSAFLFKAISVTYAASSALAIVMMNLCGEVVPHGQVIGLTICQIPVLGCLVVFCVAKDIGRRRSVGMSALMIVAALAQIVMIYAFGIGDRISGSFVRLILAVTFFIMVFAKYRDKAAMGIE